MREGPLEPKTPRRISTGRGTLQSFFRQVEGGAYEEIVNASGKGTLTRVMRRVRGTNEETTTTPQSRPSSMECSKREGKIQDASTPTRGAED